MDDLTSELSKEDEQGVWTDKDLTCIQVSKDTRDRLKKFKITKRDSYEEILIRFMDMHDKKV